MKIGGSCWDGEFSDRRRGSAGEYVFVGMTGVAGMWRGKHGRSRASRRSVHGCCWFVELLPGSLESRHCSLSNHRGSLQPHSKPPSLHKRRREFAVVLYCRQSFCCWPRGKTSEEDEDGGLRVLITRSTTSWTTSATTSHSTSRTFMLDAKAMTVTVEKLPPPEPKMPMTIEVKIA
nr:hypothetical protein Iba_chr02aCG15750 [Ipomoea batatas]